MSLVLLEFLHKIKYYANLRFEKSMENRIVDVCDIQLFCISLFLLSINDIL
jgi:hypothetical protein